MHSDFAILMGIYNGGKYLSQQLNSILDQTDQNWILYVSDDCSTDNSLDIISGFKQNVGSSKLKTYNGPQKGFAKNFVSLLTKKEISALYYALSDQDDIWLPEKLMTARKFLESIDPKIPALYCGCSVYINAEGGIIGVSSCPGKPLSFQNALVQNIASGNTMIMNRAARELLCACGQEIEVYAHDWLIYLLISGANGIIYFDKKPLVQYRQHDKNQIGMNIKLNNKLSRLKQALSGEYVKWIKLNLNVLKVNRSLLSDENKIIFDRFLKINSSFRLNRCLALYHSGVYRQKSYQNVLLYLSLFLELGLNL